MKCLALLAALYLAFMLEAEYVDEHVGWLVSLGPVERFGRRCGW